MVKLSDRSGFRILVSGLTPLPLPCSRLRDGPVPLQRAATPGGSMLGNRYAPFAASSACKSSEPDPYLLELRCGRCSHPLDAHIAKGEPRPAVLRILLPDLLADGVLLLVQRSLFKLREVAPVLRGHRALFAADLAVVLVQCRCLRVRQVAFFHLVVNPLVLVRQARVDLFAARMMLLERRVGRSGCADKAAGQQDGHNDPRSDVRALHDSCS